MQPVTNPSPGDQPEAGGTQSRRPYRTPRLIDYGDVRDVTLGPSPGLGDSGNPTLLQSPGFSGPQRD